MNIDVDLKEAIKVIEEWGINEDDFIAHKVKYSLTGGEPNDNSIELGEYFEKCLKIIVDLGLYEANKLQTLIKNESNP